jgi:hypothetical protein
VRGFGDRVPGHPTEPGMLVDLVAARSALAGERHKFTDALRFLIHDIEEMPIDVGDNHDHCGSDSQVRLIRKGTNTHSLSRSGMIERIRCPARRRWMIRAGSDEPNNGCDGDQSDCRHGKGSRFGYDSAGETELRHQAKAGCP